MNLDSNQADPLSIEATLERYRRADAALTEIVDRANELQAATDRMAGAETTLGSAARTLDANATAIRELSTALAGVSGQLGMLVSALLAMDPKKVRQDLDDLRAAVEAGNQRVVDAEREIRARIAQTEQHLESTAADHARVVLGAVEAGTARLADAERTVGARIAEAEQHLESIVATQASMLVSKLRPWLIVATALLVLAFAGIVVAAVRG